MPTPRDRRLPFEGAVNFRDMGGYPAGAGRRTRWARLYRADNLGDLTPADLTRLDALGLRTLIDFRLPLER
jgi:protein-tyrosine phosphatase